MTGSRSALGHDGALEPPPKVVHERLGHHSIALTLDIFGHLFPRGVRLGLRRLWRTIKYEEVYLRAYDSVSQARASIARYLAFYNGRRRHSSLDERTPDAAYFSVQPLATAA